jgi:hypothetical protein
MSVRAPLPTPPPFPFITCLFCFGTVAALFVVVVPLVSSMIEVRTQEEKEQLFSMRVSLTALCDASRNLHEYQWRFFFLSFLLVLSQLCVVGGRVVLGLFCFSVVSQRRRCLVLRLTLRFSASASVYVIIVFFFLLSLFVCMFVFPGGVMCTSFKRSRKSLLS